MALNAVEFKLSLAARDFVREAERASVALQELTNPKRPRGDAGLSQVTAVTRDVAEAASTTAAQVRDELREVTVAAREAAEATARVGESGSRSPSRQAAAEQRRLVREAAAEQRRALQEAATASRRAEQDAALSARRAAREQQALNRQAAREADLAARRAQRESEVAARRAGGGRPLGGVGGALATAREEATRLTESLAEAALGSGQLSSSAAGLATRFGQVGVAAAGLAGGAVALSSAAERVKALEAAFTGATGSAAQAASELAFVRTEAERLGLSLDQVADGYLSLAASTRGTALEGQATREAFLAIAESGVALQRSGPEISRALSAVAQIAGKGKVELEELRGQLAEALPGAIPIAARALNTTQAGLNDLVSDGLDATTFITAFSRQLREELGASAEEAGNNLAGAARRTSNEFSLLLAGLGRVVPVSSVFTLALNSITAGLNFLRQSVRGVLVAIPAVVQKTSEALNRIGVLSDSTLSNVTATNDQLFEQIDRLLLFNSDQGAAEPGGESPAQAQARKDAAERLETEKDTAEALLKEQASLEQKRAELEERAAEERRDRVRDAGADELRERQATLRQLAQAEQQRYREAVRAEKDAADEILEIRRAVIEQALSDEQSINDRRRATQEADIRATRGDRAADAFRQTDIQAEVASQVLRASEALGEGQFDAATAAAERIRDLARELEDFQQFVEAIKAASTLDSQAQQGRIAALEIEAEAARRVQAEAQASAAAAAQAVAVLEQALDRLAAREVQVRISADTAAIDAELSRIEARLRALNPNALSNTTIEGKTAPRRFRVGGLLPGYGGGDRRLILAEDGEFVVRKEAVARYRGLIESINSMRLPRYRTGGLVPSISAGGSSGGGRTDTVEIRLSGPGGQPVRLFGERAQARALVDTLSALGVRV